MSVIPVCHPARASEGLGAGPSPWHPADVCPLGVLETRVSLGALRGGSRLTVALSPDVDLSPVQFYMCTAPYHKSPASPDLLEDDSKTKCPSQLSPSYRFGWTDWGGVGLGRKIPVRAIRRKKRAGVKRTYGDVKCSHNSRVWPGTTWDDLLQGNLVKEN